MTHIPPHTPPPHGDGPSQPDNAGQPNNSAQAGRSLKDEYFDFTGYKFRVPPIWPRSIRDVRPSWGSGFKSIFKTAHMPMDARIGYWIWLIGSALAVVASAWAILYIIYAIIFHPFLLVALGMMSFFGGIRWGVIAVYIILMLFTLLMMVANFLLTLKLREGSEWARFLLTAISLAGVVYNIIITSAGSEAGGGGEVFVSILSILLLVFFWLPKANDWFMRTTDHQKTPTRSDIS